MHAVVSGRWVGQRQPVYSARTRKQTKPKRVCSGAAVRVVPLAVALQQLDVHDAVVCERDSHIGGAKATVYDWNLLQTHRSAHTLTPDALNI